MKKVRKSLFAVFIKQPRYLVAAIAIAFIIVTAVLWFQNWAIILTILSFPNTTLLMKLHFLLSLYPGILTNFSLSSAAALLLIAFLFGVQLALITYYIRRVQKVFRTTSWRSHGASGVALMVGAFGIGCAACGTLIATALLSTVGAGGLLLLLPLHGAEFGFLGVVILVTSIYFLLQKISDPLTCPTS